MELRNDLRERLVSELRLTVNLMRSSESVRETLYYFSVVYLEIGRIINWQWEASLALIWLVTQQVHQRATAKAQSMLQGDRIAPLPDDYFENLIKATNDLADYIEGDGNDEELSKVMKEFAVLVYLTTGNGYYLMQKQAIIDPEFST